MIKFEVPVKGMHCRSCELLIEDSVKEIAGVTQVRANTKEKNVEITSERSLSKSEVTKAIEQAGYQVGVEEKSILTKDPEAFKELVTAGIFLVALYLLARTFGLDQIGTSTNTDNSSLLVVFTIGLTAGLSTCMALVGGLILGISARHAEKHPEATPLQNFRPHLFFNVGRVLSYFVLGGVIGQIGSIFKLSGTTLGLITLAVGAIMLYMGLGLIEIFPGLKSGPTLPKLITKMFNIQGRESKEYSHKNSLLLGALTFFLPCGFTQAMQVLAISTGNFLSGALIMGVFALGTTPGLIAIGGLTSYIKKGYFGRIFFKFVGLLVIALSLFNLSNGLNLTGLKGYLVSDKSVEDSSSVKEENGVQVVRMDQNLNGYSPNKFTIKAGVPVKWIINSKDSNSCASSIIVQKLGVQKTLKPGENIVEFTPKEPGNIRFTCSMGMYSGSFTVVDGSTDTPKQEDNSSNDGNTQEVTAPKATAQPAGPLRTDVQVFKATYDNENYIQPANFSVKVDKPVRIEIEPKEDGVGCMSSVMIPGIVNEPEYMEKGKTVVFEFTPTKIGSYQLTCAMGISFGRITIN